MWHWKIWKKNKTGLTAGFFLLRQFPVHLMALAVGGPDAAGLSGVDGAAVQAGQTSARFLQDQAARREIPRGQAALEEDLDTPGGHLTDIQLGMMAKLLSV